MAAAIKTVSSPAAMQQLAATVAARLTSGDVLLLTGELGAGKTTFTQGLAKALGITEPITSPTFTIVSEYQIPNNESLKTLVHVDLYRLEDAAAAQDPAVRDVLDRASHPGQLTVIEWSEKLGDAAPKEATRIAFAHGATENERIVTMTDA